MQQYNRQPKWIFDTVRNVSPSNGARTHVVTVPQCNVNRAQMAGASHLKSEPQLERDDPSLPLPSINELRKLITNSPTCFTRRVFAIAWLNVIGIAHWSNTSGLTELLQVRTNARCHVNAYTCQSERFRSRKCCWQNKTSYAHAYMCMFSCKCVKPKILYLFWICLHASGSTNQISKTYLRMKCINSICWKTTPTFRPFVIHKCMQGYIQ